MVLDGEATLTLGGEETVLRRYDSCTIAPDEVRKIENRSNHVFTLLVVIPYPDSAT